MVGLDDVFNHVTLRLLLACDEPEGGARSLVRGKTWVEAGPGLVSSPEENGGEGNEEEEEEASHQLAGQHPGLWHPS